MTASKKPTNQVELLTELADILTKNELQNISLEQDGVRVELHAPAVEMAPITTAIGANTPSQVTVNAAAEENLIPITSPMVGVFYRSPSPNDPPFVEVGDKVEIGQTVGLVEAMKVFNEITSEVEGIVAVIKAENSDLVENGSPLLLLRPAE